MLDKVRWYLCLLGLGAGLALVYGVDDPSVQIRGLWCFFVCWFVLREG